MDNRKAAEVLRAQSRYAAWPGIREACEAGAEALERVDQLEELVESISGAFPINACHKYKETGVSLLDDVKDLIAERDRLDRELAERMRRDQNG